MKHCLKQREKNKQKNQCFVFVEDDWFPCYDRNKVRMFFNAKSKYIGIWGEDDFGMEKFNATEDEYNKLKGQLLSKKTLKALGFQQA